MFSCRIWVTLRKIQIEGLNLTGRRPFGNSFEVLLCFEWFKTKSIQQHEGISQTSLQKKPGITAQILHDSVYEAVGLGRTSHGERSGPSPLGLTRDWEPRLCLARAWGVFWDVGNGLHLIWCWLYRKGEVLIKARAVSLDIRELLQINRGFSSIVYKEHSFTLLVAFSVTWGHMMVYFF